MLKIEVKSTEIEVRQGNKNGNDWKIRTQNAYAYIQTRNGQPAPFPEKISLQLENANSSHPDQDAYPVGIYYLSDSSMYVGDFSALRLGRPVLISENEVRAMQEKKAA